MTTSEARAHPRTELALLLASTRVDPNPDELRRLRECLEPQLDWDALLLLAKENGVMPLLHRNLQAIGEAGTPEKARRKLRAYYHANAAHAVRQTEQLLGILDLLQAHGIEAVPHKGPALGASLYGSTALRPFSDLDIVVRKHELLRAADLIASSGFLLTDDMYRKPLERSGRRFFLKHKAHLNFVRWEDRTFIELHWAFMPAYWSFRFRPESLSWGGTMVLEGREVRTFRPEDLLVILCAHGSKHFWQRLVWVSDVARLLHAHPRLDWDEIARTSRRVGAWRMLLVALAVASAFLDAPVPAEILSSAERDPVVTTLVAEVCAAFYAQDAQHPGGIEDESLFYFRLRERLRDRVPFFWYYLWRPTDKDTGFLPLPDRLSFLYRVVRPVRIIMDAARNPARIARLLGRSRRESTPSRRR